MGKAESKPKPGEEEEGQQALFGNPFSFLSEVTCVGVFPVRGHLIACYRDLSWVQVHSHRCNRRHQDLSVTGLSPWCRGETSRTRHCRYGSSASMCGWNEPVASNQERV